MLSRPWLFAAAAALACLPSAFADDARGNKDHLAVDPAEADDDFPLQGEYMGDIFAGPHAGRAGLQVVALGGGKFDGVLYPGGLPGNHWTRRDKTKLSGSRAGEGAELSAEPLRIRVRELWADVYDGQRRVGRLKKVRRISPTLHLRPPAGAKVLFDGASTEHFQRGKLTPAGHLAAGAVTAEPVGDFRLHLEFLLPYKPHARGQGRGNSGVYIQQRYEVQILDSFGLEGDANECGGLYRQRAPDVNMCLPPLAWQTYDIWFTAARFDGEGNKTRDARITVKHNGIQVHDDVQITGKTGAGRQEGPQPLPILLQDHGNPVAFRNIWIVEGDGRYYKPLPTSVYCR